jgi:ribonuclease R
MSKKKNKGLKKSEINSMVKDIFFNNSSKTFNYKQLSEMLGIVNKNERQLVQLQLLELLKTGFITEVTTGRYKMVVNITYVTGKVDVTASGSAFIIPKDGSEDVFVTKSNLNKALKGDTVKVALYSHRKTHRPEGEVVEITTRKRELFVGTIEISKKYAFLITDTKVINRDIFIPLDKIKNAKNGQKVVVKITEWDKKDKNPIGEVVDILGNKGENNAEMHAILAEFNLPYSYPENVIAEAEKISGTIPLEEISKRKDFRDVVTFTIDPEDAKDFDDALSIRKLDNDLWEIGVHIADVTHYVHPDTVIDKEGYERATSVYLVDRVVPMLPERLSNFLCSLRPNEDKLCFSIVFTMNSEATVKDQWIGRTVINSDRRYSYEEAQEILDTGEGDFAFELKTINELAKKMREKRFKMGAIEFERFEVSFNIDENGKPLSVFFKEAKDSNNLIEEFMLLANKKVAEFVGKGGNKTNPKKTFIYRIHDQPDPEKYNNFTNFAKKFGIETNEMAYIGNEEKDIIGANNAGMVSILINRTDKKTSYGENYQFRNLKNMWSYLKRKYEL